MISYQHLLGQTYEIGERDCYSLIRGFYKDNFGITLTNYARPDQWWVRGFNLYYDNFRKEGFSPVDDTLQDLQVGDLLLMAFDCEFPNHCAVYVGNGRIIHHPYRQLSREEGLKGMYRNHLVAVIRRPNLPQPTRQESVLNLETILPQRWKDKINAQDIEEETIGPL